MRFTDGLEAFCNVREEPWEVHHADGQVVTIAPFGHWVIGPELDAGTILGSGGAIIEYSATQRALYVEGRGDTVTWGGVTTDGAVALRFDGGGSLELFPLTSFEVARGGGRERFVETTFVELSGELLDRHLPAGRLVRSGHTLPAEPGDRRQPLEERELERGPGGALRFEAADWLAAGAAGYELRARPVR
jgi:hypothetical protein